MNRVPRRSRLAPAVVLLLVSCLGAPALAGAEAPPGALAASSAAEVFPEEAFDEIPEAVEPVRVEVPKPPLVVRMMGRGHPALCHFPIAWLVLLCAAELFYLARGRPLQRIGLVGLWVTVLSFLPAMASGVARAYAKASDDPETLALIVLHRNMMMTVALLCLAALLLRLRAGRSFTGTIRRAYVGVLTAASALVLVGGHFGGKLVHG